MKINKLIKDINNYYLKKLMKKEQVFYQIEDDYILLSDKYIIAILKKDEFYLNNNLMKQNDLLVKFIKELNDEEYVMLQNASDEVEEEKDNEIARLTWESTKWESKFYDEAKKVDKAIEYCKELMLFKKNSRQYLIGKCMLEILGGVDKE